ncbi:hypothetical protein PtA15_2A935 [Puccinia triticina]|uniref:Endoplasmic reticulum junction formation protein lunapark n=1 Tax=Puccinia triticina TaxID=208348 RepID=A0ABY7CE25_9BASI|nr:uncharacterized protein PtA15_2A935 [Puccinia triticina]WAQ82618.1 hypothetical protein PtA15_2A935 [Puccinia triticina]
MGLFSFLRPSSQPTPDLFEKELVQLELKISSHQERLKAIDQRQRSTTSTITIYSSLFWSIYTCLWYFGWTPIKWLHLGNRLISPNSKTLLSTNPKLNQSIQVLPIILIPIGLLSFRWLVQTWYQRKQESEKLRLRLLQKQLRDKIEELKKKTAYYSTKELLDRYDEKTKLNSQSSPQNPHQPGRMTMTPPNNEALRQRHRPPSSSPATLSNSLSPMQNNNSSPAHQMGPLSGPPPAPHQQHLHQQHQKILTTPSPTNGRGWADRFAEVLLGDDEARPESKYALICIKCFAHNGLVRQEELDQIQYLCPKCGTFNPSKNKMGRHNHPSGEERLSDEGAGERKAGSINSQGKRGGRKSLADSMIRRKPPIDDSFNVVHQRRVVSQAAGIPTSSSSSLSLDHRFSQVSQSNRTDVDNEDVLTDDYSERPDISQADRADNDYQVEDLETSDVEPPHPQPVISSSAAPTTLPDRKSKKKSSAQKVKKSG